MRNEQEQRIPHVPVMREYTIKCKNPGRMAYREVRKLYAANWYGACQEFKAWVCEWLGEMSYDEAQRVAEDVCKLSMPFEVRWDGYHYTIKGV